MPFLSKAQSKACFATHGFGNKIDCKEWAHATNYKKLPMKKLRGGKMQTGGIFNNDGSWSPGYYDKKTDTWVSTGADVPARKAMNFATPSVAPSVTPSMQAQPNLAWMNTAPIQGAPANPYTAANFSQNPNPPATQQFHGPQAAGYDEFVNGLPDNHPDKPITAQPAGNYTDNTPPKRKDKLDPYFLLHGVTTGLSWLSGMVDRNRQNQYMQQQYSTLGQLNPVNTNDYQPNPYNLYAEKGGTIKDNDMTSNQLKKNLRGNSGPQMKKGGNWLKGAVNPAHKGWCTPLSNPHCTGHRRAFALMMKKKHGFHGS